MFRYLLTLESGEPADPAVFVTSRSGWEVGEDFAAHDGSRWRIVSLKEAHHELAAQGFEAIVTVAPMD